MSLYIPQIAMISRNFSKIFVQVKFQNFYTVFYLNLLCSIQSGPWAKTIPDEVKVGCSSGEILLNKALVVWSSSDFCDAKNACMILRKFRGLPEHRSSLKTLKNIENSKSLRFFWCTRVMPLPLIFVSDTFPILPPAIIFFNQRQRQNGTPRK